MHRAQTLIFLFGLCLVNKAFAEEPKSKQSAENEDTELLDTIERGVTTTVDSTARWFDQFFGDPRAFEDEYGTHGRLSLGPEWSEFSGWRFRSSLRARVNLPHAERRFSAFIGRVDADEFLTTEDNSQGRGSVIRNMSGDNEWLIGLGFDPHQGEQNRFNISAGIRGGLNADLYTEARYLFQYRISDNTQIRTRTAGFWRDSDGFGYAQRVDYEQTMQDDWLTRISAEGTQAERVDGIRWHANAALYHLYREERAIATEFWYYGETKAPVPHKDIGVRFIHRQSWQREWLYLEKWIGMHWPKDEPDHPRERSWMVGFKLEMWYGEHN